MVLGSVSRYVADRAACPVVVVRQDTVAVHREIAVGIRDPHDAAQTLAFGFEEAALRGADLVAVRAWLWLPPAPHVPAQAEKAGLQRDRVEQISAEAANAPAETLNAWRDKYPEVRVHQDLIPGHPGRVLAGYSARADLVVLGRHGRSDSGHPAVGSVRHAVLEHAHGPVAVIPQFAAAPSGSFWQVQSSFASRRS